MAITPSDVAITAGSGTTINTVDVTNGAATDKRQVVAIGGPNTGDLSIVAPVLSARPGASELGLTVREAAQGQAAMAASIPVVVASDQSVLPVQVTDITAVVNIASSTGTQAIAMQGRSSCAVIITSLGTGGQVVIEGSIDGSTWVQLDVYAESIETWVTGTITTTGSWWVESLGAFNSIRVRATALTSGTITGLLLASFAAMHNPEYSGGLGVTAPPNAVYVAGSDGTNMRGLAVTAGGVLKIQAAPQTSGGLGLPLSITLTNANTPVKGSAGQMYGYHLVNNNSTISYVQVFNKLTGNVTLGTTAADFVIPLPPNGGAVMYLSAGMAFSIGLVMGATTTRTGGVAPTNGVEALVYFA